MLFSCQLKEIKKQLSTKKEIKWEIKEKMWTKNGRYFIQRNKKLRQKAINLSLKEQLYGPIDDYDFHITSTHLAQGITIQPMKLAVGLELIPVYRIKPQAKKTTKYTWNHSSCYELAKMPWKWINKRNERSNSIKWSNAPMLYMFSCCLSIGFCTLKCFVAETRERWNRIDAFALFTLLN